MSTRLAKPKHHMLAPSILIFALGGRAFAADPVSIHLAHRTVRETQTAQTLKLFCATKTKFAGWYRNTAWK